MTLTVGSLFSGIGGIDLGLERAGMQVVWQAETDPYCSRVLAKHWPGVPNLGDVTTVDWSTVDRPDLIAGGYPCQPFSLAGQRAGEGDERHLWPHMARALRVLRPDWALLENVPGHLSLGFDTVQADLACLGYDTEWESIPAAAVGAPHLRWRIFVVAHAISNELRDQPITIGRGSSQTVPRDDGVPRDVADANGDGRRQGPGQLRRLGTERCRPAVADTDCTTGRQEGNAQPAVSRGARRGTSSESGGRGSGPLADATESERRTEEPQDLAATRQRAAEPGECYSSPVTRSDWWNVEPDVGRVAHGIPHRVDRLRALGNAVVPQVAELVGRQIIGAAA